MSDEATTKTTTITTTTTSILVDTRNATSSVVSPNGLRLTLSLSQTVFPQGSGVTIGLSLFNTLPARNNLTVPSGEMDPFSLGLCNQLPFGYAAFKGNYETGNVSQGKAMELSWPGGTASCSAMVQVAYWSLASLSDNITLVSQQPTGQGNATAPQDVWTQEAAANMETWGYWTGRAQSYPSLNVSFGWFSPGSYTVAAGDAWGQLTLLHFRVLSATNALTCASVASTSSFIVHSNASISAGPLSLQAYYQELGSNGTYVLALSSTGESPITLSYFGYASSYELFFNPDSSQVQTWQYFSFNGSLAYPATFKPNQCSLIRVILPQASNVVQLTMDFNDNQTQTITLNP